MTGWTQRHAEEREDEAEVARLLRENMEELDAELAKLREENAELAKLRKENEALREHLRQTEADYQAEHDAREAAEKERDDAKARLKRLCDIEGMYRAAERSRDGWHDRACKDAAALKTSRVRSRRSAGRHAPRRDPHRRDREAD